MSIQQITNNGNERMAAVAATAPVPACSAASNGWIQWTPVRFALHTFANSTGGHLPFAMQTCWSDNNSTSL